MKKFVAVAVFLSALCLSAAQIWQKNGIVELKSGDYTISVMPKNNGRISGFAFKGKELFISPSATAGTAFSPAVKETPVSLKLTVDGKTPDKVAKAVTGKNIQLERVTKAANGVIVISTYILTPEGFTWNIRCKLENPGKKPTYFYLFSMPWKTGFTKYSYENNGKTKSGEFTNSGKWLINSSLQELVLCDPAEKISVTMTLHNNIPGEVRHHTIWDHKQYHKYYFFFRIPEWKNGFETPTYSMSIKAADTKAPAAQKTAAPQAKAAPVKKAPAIDPAAMPDGKITKIATLDFEEKNVNNVNEEPYTGKLCYKFPGAGKGGDIALPLKNNTAYRITGVMRKDVCHSRKAAAITFSVGNYDAAGKNFQVCYTGGSKGVYGDNKWNDFSGIFTTNANGGNYKLRVNNNSDVLTWFDDIVIEELDKAAKDKLLAMASSTKVVRPIPPITKAQSEKEDWLTNRRGIEALDDDFILPPFTPVKLHKNSTSIWGREYTFSKYNLLEKVKILGENFLTTPMEFTAVVNGKKVNFKTGNQIVLRERKGIVEFFTRANSTDVDIEVRTAVEYDGMIKVDFTFDPRGSVQIDKFQYTITYPEKYAKFIHYTGSRDGYSLNVPRTSNTRRLPEGKGVVWESPFKLLVWLGSYDRGLLWFCASEKDWSPHNTKIRKEGLSVSRDDGQVKLTITPVSAPKLIGKRTTYTFGLMATPVRPRTPGWRNTDMTYEYYAQTAKRLYGAHTPVIYSSGSYDIVPPQTRRPDAAAYYPRLYDKEAYRNRVKKAHANGALFALYIDPILCSLGIYKDMADYQTKITDWDPTTDNADGADTKIEAPFLWQPPEVEKYFLEWRKEPVSTAPYSKNLGERQFQPGLGSRYADLFCYFMSQHAELGCDGIANLDEWGPVPDSNARHDMGYYDVDGKRYPEYDWFGRRNLIKRMCGVFYKKHGKLPIMRVHLAATLVVPIASFCDSVVTGENINSAYFNGAKLMDKYTVNSKEILKSIADGGKDFLYYVSDPDRWAIEYGGQAFGWSCCIMSNLTKSPQIDPEYASSDEGTRDYLAMCLMHDNTLWPVFCKPDSAYKLMKIKQDFRIGDDKVIFYPYWGEKHPVSVNGKECYAVTWQNGDSCLAAVANLSLKGQDLTVTLDRKFFSGQVKIIDAESKEEIKLNKNSFSLKIPRRNYRIFLIKK